MLQPDTQALRQRTKQNENLRLVELLEGDERSLRRILDGLEAIEASNAEQPGRDIDVIELAAKRHAKARKPKP
jgi:hypothetical protein